MVGLKNIEGLDGLDIRREIEQGGRFVMFRYTISCLFLTFYRKSDIYFIRSSESASKVGLRYSLKSAGLGWWGLPWGPIFTIKSLYSNFKGGKDVTAMVVRTYPGITGHTTAEKGKLVQAA